MKEEKTNFTLALAVVGVVAILAIFGIYSLSSSGSYPGMPTSDSQIFGDNNLVGDAVRASPQTVVQTTSRTQTGSLMQTPECNEHTVVLQRPSLSVLNTGHTSAGVFVDIDLRNRRVFSWDSNAVSAEPTEVRLYKIASVSSDSSCNGNYASVCATAGNQNSCAALTYTRPDGSPSSCMWNPDSGCVGDLHYQCSDFSMSEQACTAASSSTSSCQWSQGNPERVLIQTFSAGAIPNTYRYVVSNQNNQGLDALFEIEYVYAVPHCNIDSDATYIPSTRLLNPHVLDVRDVNVVRTNALDRVVHRELLIGNNDQWFFHENVEIDSIELRVSACPADGVPQITVPMATFEVLGVDSNGNMIVADGGFDTDAFAVQCYYNNNVFIHYDVKVYNSFTNQYRTQTTTLRWRNLGSGMWSI